MRIALLAASIATATLGLGVYLSNAAELPQTTQLPQAPDLAKLTDVSVKLPGNKGLESTFKVKSKDDLNLTDVALKHLVKAELKNYGDISPVGAKLKDIDPTRQVLVTTEEYSDGTTFNVLSKTYKSGTRTVATDAQTGSLLSVRVTYDSTEASPRTPAPPTKQ